MLLALLYVVVCGLLRLHLVPGKRLTAAEIELLALRHERRVLRRRTGGAAWRPADRLLLAALSRCLPPGERYRLPVHPATLRRWQRELLERRWVALGRRRRPGRPPLDAQRQALIVRLSGVWMPETGGQRVQAKEGRRTDAPRWGAVSQGPQDPSTPDVGAVPCPPGLATGWERTQDRWLPAAAAARAARLACGAGSAPSRVRHGRSESCLRTPHRAPGPGRLPVRLPVPGAHDLQRKHGRAAEPLPGGW